jgi:hypothetical protein
MLAKILKTFILLLWLVMLGLLIHRSYIRPASVIALDVITDEGVRAGDEWFGIYQQGRKIGYAHTQVAPEGPAYHLFEESEIDILAMETVQRVRTVINSYASRNFLLQYFDFTMQSSLTNMQIKGAVVKKDLVLDITTGGQTRKERIRLKEPPYLSPNVKPALILMGLETGRTYRFPLFNPLTMNTDDALITVEAKDTIKVGDREVPVYRLKESLQGMVTTSWINEEGETIKEVSPLGYMILRESAVEAKKLDKLGPAVDIIALTMIPSDPVPDSDRTTYLRARLANVPLRGFQLDGDRQTLKDETLEIRAEKPRAPYRLPSSDGNLMEFLRPSPFVQSDDPAIKNQAARILAGESDAAAAAKKLNDWVYTAIRKQPVVSIPSAVEVLKQKVGDCNEHTALYAALARSVGLPTRMAAGIVYMENGFYYHAWPEVWLGAWIAVDPTLDQFPADATHIRFTTGNLDRQMELMQLVGKLRVEVLEYKYNAEFGLRNAE